MIGKCETCNSGDLRIRKSKKGSYFVGCNNFPDCKNVYFFKRYDQFKKFKQTKSKCKKCKNFFIKCNEENGAKKLCIENCENSIKKFLKKP